MLVSSRFIHSTLRYMTFTLILSLSSFANAASCEPTWPAWEAFKKTFINQEGRVIDSSTMKTTSEGQSYALFFALVANDKETFNKLINWTETHQSKNDLTTHLPSWAWGKGEDGKWGGLDENSASDSDLWIAYALGEAGRLWGDRRYIALSSLIANRVLASETIEVPGLGLVLLPGATGFTPTPTRVRLNPSYVPMQVMRWFVTHSKDQRWASLLKSSEQLIIKSAPEGYAPDWIIYDYDKGFLPDQESIGSYNAIRVYLWAGMLSRDDAVRERLLDALKPMARLIERRGLPPESVNVLTGDTNNDGPSGFSAAMIPFLLASSRGKAAEQQLLRIKTEPVAEDSYYGQVLSLYALGWHDNLYQFDSKGNLTPRWTSTCP